MMSSLSWAVPRSGKVLLSRLPGLSATGWFAALLGACCLMFWLPTRWNEFLAIALVLESVTALSMFSSAARHRIRINIGEPTHTVTVGDEIIVPFTISNRARRRGARRYGLIPVSDGSTIYDRTLNVPSMRPNEPVTVDMRFTASSRSVLHIGPVRVESCDPFGFTQHQAELSNVVHIHVHPPTIMLTLPRVGFMHAQEGEATERTADTGMDFQSLRSYRPGDDLRNVHWSSSAKTDSLVVRQYASVRRTDTALTMSTDPDDYADRGEFELAVAMYASIGATCLAQQRSLIVSTANRITSASHMTSFLDSCSEIVPAKPAPSTTIDQTIGHCSADDYSPDSRFSDAMAQASCQFLIVGSKASFQKITALLPERSVSPYRMVIRACSEAAGTVVPLPSCTMIVAGSLQDLRTALAVIP